MKNLIKNYIEKLNVDKLKQFSLDNNINLSNIELEYILKLVKENLEDILKDDTKYLKLLENNINQTEFIKIKELYLYYKNKYKMYLF